MVLCVSAIKPGAATPNNRDGLGAATKELPDLRTPVMESGLSVDFQWQPDQVFDVNH
ncbi:MAG: hypothetical protein IJ145_08320 [Prevotella sp.]|nr:hypothetical protein [Prevotella sp.]